MDKLFNIPSNSRVIGAGQTGSGKTILFEEILKPASRLLVLDAKDNLSKRFGGDLQEYNKRNLRRLANGDDMRMRITAPIADERTVIQFWEHIFEVAYQIRDLIIYIDETYSLTNGANSIEYYFNACYTRGRELGIGIFAATQRPVDIPKIMMTEAGYIFCLRLMNEDDRIRMAKYMGKEVKERILDEHGFYYYNVLKDKLFYIPKLDIEK